MRPRAVAAVLARIGQQIRVGEHEVRRLDEALVRRREVLGLRLPPSLFAGREIEVADPSKLSPVLGDRRQREDLCRRLTCEIRRFERRLSVL